MSKSKNSYTKPPVIECSCLVQFAAPSGDFTSWGQFYRSVKAAYPTKTETYGLLPTPKSKVVDDYTKVFISEDNAQAIAATTEAFGFHRLIPYCGFAHFKRTFRSAFSAYQSVFSPTALTRVLLCYRNQIVIPRVPIRVDDYFRVVPMLPMQADEVTGGIKVCLALHPVVATHHLRTELRTVDAVAVGCSFFLAIEDIFEVPPDSVCDLWQVIDDAHTNIVDAFERLIQDPLREIFGAQTTSEDRRS